MLLCLFKVLQDEIIKRKRDVDDIKDVCFSLKELRSKDESLTTTVSKKVEFVEHSYTSITLDAERRYRLLQKALLSGQEFESTFNDFNICLEDLETRMRNSKPLDARLEVLDSIIVEHEVCLQCFFS